MYMHPKLIKGELGLILSTTDFLLWFTGLGNPVNKNYKLRENPQIYIFPML
jgi:hypothetical protein